MRFMLVIILLNNFGHQIFRDQGYWPTLSACESARDKVLARRDVVGWMCVASDDTYYAPPMKHVAPIEEKRYARN